MKSKVLGFVGIFSLIVIAVSFSVTAKKQSFEQSFLMDANEVESKSGTYKFDLGHSSVGFKVKHMGLVYVPGFFNKFDGEINYDGKNIEKSSVNFSIETASVDTRNARRDGHLRSKDFFNAEANPKITFVSKKVTKSGEMLDVTGDLTMAGKTKEITIPINVVGFKEGRRGGTTMGATGMTKIKRSEFGITYGINGSIGDEVTIDINVEAKGK